MPIFADNAYQLANAGFAVIPAAGKAPLISGFPKWKIAPRAATLQKWAVKHPDANIAYLPGLCHTGSTCHGVIVIDADDASAVEQVGEIFGPTPGMVRTRRGKHCLYRDGDGSSLGKVASLKCYGINADVKHGLSIVVAPPSRHQEDQSFAYAWEGCDETVIRDLPTFNRSALKRLLDTQISPSGKFQPNVTNTARPPLNGMRDGSRGLALNDHLVSQAWACDTFNDLLDCANTFNMQLTEVGLAPLPEKEVLARAAAVWRDQEIGKLERWHSLPAVARTNAKEIRDVCGGGKNGGDAFTLLMLLRAEHLVRVLRSETFSLDVKAMSASGTLPWTIERFRNAIQVLIRNGYIQMVTPYKNTKMGRVPAQYTLR